MPHFFDGKVNSLRHGSNTVTSRPRSRPFPSVPSSNFSISASVKKLHIISLIGIDKRLLFGFTSELKSCLCMTNLRSWPFNWVTRFIKCTGKFGGAGGRLLFVEVISVFYSLSRLKTLSSWGISSICLHWQGSYTLVHIK